MSNITFLAYTPNQEKKRNLGGAACVNCRRAHAACNTYRPCDRCVRTKCECVETLVVKKKKLQGDSSVDDINSYLDVDTVSELLFSDTSANSLEPIFPPPTPDLVVPSPTNLATPPHQSPPTVFSSFSPAQPNTPTSMQITAQQNSVPITSQNQFATNQIIPQNFPQSQFITHTQIVPQAQSVPQTISFFPSGLLDFPSSEAEQFVKSHPGEPTITFAAIPPSTNDQVSVSGVNSTNVVAKVEELAALNKRMEQTVLSLAQKVEQLETQMQQTPSRIYVTPVVSNFTPATASWKLPYCELLEYNQAFLDIMGYRVDGESPPVTFFELGACKDKIAMIKKKIEHSIENNEPLTDPTVSHTLIVPLIKKNKEVIQMNLSVVIMLSAPQPVMTTIMHPMN